MAQSARADEPHEGFEGVDSRPPETVGVFLARARQEIGQSVSDVATNLRIRRIYLQAIEEGRYAELPGATYAVGFVRSYADYLGLDSDFLVERFKGEIAGLDRRQQLHFPAPKPEGRIPGGALILVSLLLIGLAYGGWYVANQNDLLEGVLSGASSVPSAELPAPPAADVAERAPAERAGEAPAPAARAPEAEAAGSADVTVFTEGLETSTAERSALPEEALPRTPAPPLGAAPTRSPAPEAAPSPSASPAASLPTGTPAPASPPVGGAATAGADTVQAALETAAPAPEAPAAAAGPEPAAPADAETAQTAAAAAARDVAPETPAAARAETGAAAEADLAESERADIAAAATETLEPDIPAAPEVPTQTATSDGRVYGAVNEDSRITLTATADSWVQVRSADDNLLITRVLREGDIYRVPNQEDLVLETGNAGGLQITVDGRTAPALGRPGDVVRGIALDPQALLRGRATQ